MFNREWTQLSCDDHVKSVSTSTSKVLDQLEAIPAPAADAASQKKNRKRDKSGKKSHKGEQAGLVPIAGDSLGMLVA